MKITRLLKDFIDSEKIGGIILIACTLLSLVLANSSFSNIYLNFWETNIGNHNITHWINDGLMAIFFLLIGLELEREVYIGELSKIKDALLPIVAAIGGMIVPVIIYSCFNLNSPTQSGYGIPMATDIAFALGVVSLMGNKVPASLKVFLTALAVIDDLGAILVIAIFYTSSLVWSNLLIALGIFAAMLILNRVKIHNLIPYLTGGVAMWYFMLHSGVHATITGVLTAFAIPFSDGKKKSTSYILQSYLHRPVAFLILPLFALANTAIVINSNWQDVFKEPYTIGTALGLLIGKPLGITLFSFIAVTIGLCKIPEDINWKAIFGASILGGIGFTMSIFITMLAFNNTIIINNTKLIILLSSLIAGIIGFVFLKSVLTKKQNEQVDEE